MQSKMVYVSIIVLPRMSCTLKGGVTDFEVDLKIQRSLIRKKISATVTIFIFLRIIDPHCLL